MTKITEVSIRETWVDLAEVKLTASEADVAVPVAVAAVPVVVVVALAACADVVDGVVVVAVCGAVAADLDGANAPQTPTWPGGPQAVAWRRFPP